MLRIFVYNYLNYIPLDIFILIIIKNIKYELLILHPEKSLSKGRAKGDFSIYREPIKQIHVDKETQS
jgi:hypothetical protein